MNTYALYRLIKAKGNKNNILVCSVCGSLEIQHQAWVDANQHTYCGDIDDDDISAQWCEECQEHVRFRSLEDFERKMDKDIGKLKPSDAKTEKMQKEWASYPYLKKNKIWRSLFLNTDNETGKSGTPETALSRARREATEVILGFFDRYGNDLHACDINESWSPVIRKGRNDHDIYTLDCLYRYTDGSFGADASSCDDNITIDADNISADTLTDIAEWLRDNEETIIKNRISELCDQTDIEKIEELLKPMGDVTMGVESTEDKIDSEDDNCLMLQPLDISIGNFVAHVKLYYGDCTRTVSCIETDIEAPAF